MIENISMGISLLFILSTLLSMAFFIASVMQGRTPTVRRRAHPLALLLLMWMIFQSTLALNGWYMNRDVNPPHLVFPLATSLGIFLLLFALPGGRRFLDGLHPGVLALLHVIRIPAAVGLYLLATWKQVPWSMTFAGANPDILFGITAPAIWYWGYRRKKLSRVILLVWNGAGLALLINMIVCSAGALPSPIQAWDFEQPNYAFMHFPFVWLPSVIIPLVMISHLALLRQALSERKTS
ncbi:MAG: hypothetical protein ACK505_10145 [Flavobacteriales bacterium]